MIETDCSSENARINILLLGETGIGKSTLINSLANYAQFDSLQEAEDSFVSLVRTKFMVNTADGDMKQMFSSSSHETLHELDKCQTQDVASYDIPYKGKILRLIDTPGMTNTVIEDTANCAKILKFISKLKHIHGVCVMIKPDLARITPDFMYSLLMFITRLGRPVVANIIFLFSRTRKSNYMALDTITCMGPILDDIKSRQRLDIPLKYRKVDHKNCFCFENECFNYLVARNQNVQVSTSQKCLEDGWDVSRKSMAGLVDYIAGDSDYSSLPPFVLPDFDTNDKARMLVFEMTIVLADIAQLFMSNLQDVEFHHSKSNDKPMNDVTFVPHKTIEAQPLNNGVATCMKCLMDCDLEKVQEESLSEGTLRHRLSQTCKECYCDSALHLYRYYEKREIEDSERRSTLNFCRDYYDQYELILIALAIFHNFLNQQSFKLIDDTYEEYLQASMSKRNNSSVKQNKQLLRDYQFQKKMQSTKSPPRAEDILHMVTDLKKDNLYGEMIQFLHDQRNVCHQSETPMDVDEYEPAKNNNANNSVRVDYTDLPKQEMNQHLICSISDDKIDEAYNITMDYGKEYRYKGDKVSSNTNVSNIQSEITNQTVANFHINEVEEEYKTVQDSRSKSTDIRIDTPPAALHDSTYIDEEPGSSTSSYQPQTEYATVASTPARMPQKSQECQKPPQYYYNRTQHGSHPPRKVKTNRKDSIPCCGIL